MKNRVVLFAIILVLLFSSCSSQNRGNELQTEQNITAGQASVTDESKRIESSSKADAANIEPDTSGIHSNEIDDAADATAPSVLSSIGNMLISSDFKEEITKEYAAELNQKARAHSVDGDLYYNREKVTELYSLDGTRRIYIPVSEKINIKDVVFNLDTYDGPYDNNGINGFFIVTEAGKYDIRPTGDSEQAQSIIEFSKSCNKDDKDDIGYAQWLIYMSISNMESISYIGPTGRVLKDAYYTVKLNSQQPSTMEKIGLYLKNIEVYSLNNIINDFVHPTASPSDGYLEITFKNEVKYTVMMSSGGMTIYSSDLGYTLQYNCDEKDILDFFDFVIMLDQSDVELVD